MKYEQAKREIEEVLSRCFQEVGTIEHDQFYEVVDASIADRRLRDAAITSDLRADDSYLMAALRVDEGTLIARTNDELEILVHLEPGVSLN